MLTSFEIIKTKFFKKQKNSGFYFELEIKENNVDLLGFPIRKIIQDCL